jgi:hypothetical protein
VTVTDPVGSGFVYRSSTARAGEQHDRAIRQPNVLLRKPDTDGALMNAVSSLLPMA